MGIRQNLENRFFETLEEYSDTDIEYIFITPVELGDKDTYFEDNVEGRVPKHLKKESLSDATKEFITKSNNHHHYIFLEKTRSDYLSSIPFVYSPKESKIIAEFMRYLNRWNILTQEDKSYSTSLYDIGLDEVTPEHRYAIIWMLKINWESVNNHMKSDKQSITYKNLRLSDDGYLFQEEQKICFLHPNSDQYRMLQILICQQSDFPKSKYPLIHFEKALIEKRKEDEERSPKQHGNIEDLRNKVNAKLKKSAYRISVSNTESYICLKER